MEAGACQPACPRFAFGYSRADMKILTTRSPLNYALALIACGLASSARADDWPCWRGPRHDGISMEKGWFERWPKDGPAVAWKASVGVGFSSITVADGRLYT